MPSPIRSVTVPPLPLTGGCACGAVRYAIDAIPRAFYLCHCSECQRQTSSAYGESLRCDPGSVTIEGETRTVRRMSESGTVRLGDFCPECGVRLFHRSEGDPDRLNVKAGTLDDTSWLVPAGHIWTGSKQPFVTIGDDELAYPAQPQDKSAAIFERWAQMIAAEAR